MSLTLLAIAAAAATHTTHIEHRGASVEAIYSARTDIRMRTVGAHTPNRMDNRRCQWTATVIIERQLSGKPVLARTLHGDRPLSGSQSGPCTAGTRAIDREIAHRDDAIQAQLLAVAERDRAPLLAELDAVHNMASN
ncbi:hypothetical protein [Sphingobium aromaticiconvertens]|uniref:hypothetical protein n=1 Tax=Sphingobium aromaticiconvertens TaxID=365341 RepID=UPI003018601D